MGYAVVLAFAGVASLFAGSTVYTQHRAQAIDTAAQAITDNAAPSIDRIAAARGTLRQLEFLLTEQADPHARFQPSTWHTIDGLRHALDEAVQSYLTLPAFPRERERFRATQRELLEFDSLISSVRDARRNESVPTGTTASIHALFDRLDASMEGIIALNSDEARILADRIEATRISERRFAIVLDGASATLALAAAALIVLFVRRSQRLVSTARQLAEARAEELDAFAGRVAHDIKSPLAGALLWAELTARRTSEDPSLSDPLHRFESSLRRGVQLVDALLDFARSGAQADPAASTSVHDVLTDLAEELRPVAEAENITLVFEPVDRAVRVSCPAGVLTSIAGNLVRNAIKYMGARERREIRMVANVADDAVNFVVEDTGPGMSPDVAKICFEPFRRGADVTQPGLGLGLSTVRRLVVAHRGHVGVRSRLGDGSTFWFDLPRVR